MKYVYTLTDLKPFIRGLPFLEETFPKLRRLPKETTRRLPNQFDNLSRNLSGVRLRFRSESDLLEIKGRVSKYRATENFSMIGKSGIDIYVDGTYWQTVLGAPKFNGRIRLPGKKGRVFEIYLPAYNGLKSVGIGSDAELFPPEGYRVEKPIVFYGSSITQGGCASRPGLAYTNIIGRNLGADIINYGFSGNGTGEKEIAGLIAGVPASMYVLDWGLNVMKLGFKLLQERYGQFFDIIREKNPATPILVVNLQNVAEELYSEQVHEYATMFRDHIRAEYDTRAKSDPNIHYVDGQKIIGLEELGLTVDGSHPNDLGMAKYVEILAPTVGGLIPATKNVN